MKSKIALIFSFILLLGLNGNFTTAETEFDAQSDQIKIGISKWVENEDYNENIEGFKEKLEEFGWIEGVNTEFFLENANSDKIKQSEIIQEFIDMDVDLIYSLSTSGTLIAKEMTQNIPIVFSIVTYPVEINIIDSFESSGNNLVGTSNYVSVEKQVDLIYDISNPKKIGFLHRQGELNSEIQFKRMEQYSKLQGIEVVDISTTNLDEIEQSINTVISEIDVLYNACDTLIQSGGEEISIRLGLENNKPVFSCNKKGIQLGAIAGNVANLRILGELAGNKAIMILHGANPSEIFSEKPKGDHIVVNIESVEILGIKIPTHIENIASQRFG